MRKRSFFFFIVGILFFTHSGYSKKNDCPIDLPPRIVTTAKGTKKTSAKVWFKESKRFLSSPKYSIAVEKGDTVYSLSKKYGVSIRDIITYNHLHAPFGLKVGQMLTLSNPKTHKVLKGETLYSIASQRSVDVSALAHRNQLKLPFKLVAGQELILPASIPLDDQGAILQKNTEKPLPLKKTTPKKIEQIKDKPSAIKEAKKNPEIPKGPIKFLRPVKGPIILPFGPLKDGILNDGINIKAPSGYPVKAAESGVVIYKGNDLPSYGNMILLKHQEGWVTAYAHLKSMAISKGDLVKKGQIIGAVGTTGHIKTPQLHFELRKGKKTVDPMKWV